MVGKSFTLKNNYSILVSLVILSFFLCISLSFSQGIEEITAVSEQADTMIKSGRGTITYEHGLVDSSGGWGKKYEVKKDNNIVTIVSQFYDEVIVDFAFNGEKFRAYASHKFYEPNGQLQTLYEDYLYDGENDYIKRCYHKQDHQQFFPGGEKVVFQYDPRYLLMIYHIPVAHFLKGKIETPVYLQRKNISETIENVRLAGEENIDGHICKVIKGKYVFRDLEKSVVETSNITAWLAEEYMYRPVRTEEIYMGIQTHKSIVINTFKNYKGNIWFPLHTEINEYRKGENDWIFFYHRFWTVHDDYRLNIDIPDSLFACR